MQNTTITSKKKTLKTSDKIIINFFLPLKKNTKVLSSWPNPCEKFTKKLVVGRTPVEKSQTSQQLAIPKTSWLKPPHYNKTSFQSSLLRILRKPWKLDPSYSPSCIQCVWGEGEGCQVPPIMGNQSEDKVVPFIRQRGSCHAGWKISIK